jgi:hypothetical protein
VDSGQHTAIWYEALSFLPLFYLSKRLYGLPLMSVVEAILILILLKKYLHIGQYVYSSFSTRKQCIFG